MENRYFKNPGEQLIFAAFALIIWLNLKGNSGIAFQMINKLHINIFANFVEIFKTK